MQHRVGDEGGAEAAQLLRKAILGYVLFIGLALAVGSQISRDLPVWLTFQLVIRQDIWLVAAIFILAAAVLRPPFTMARIPDLSRWRLTAIAGVVVLGCYAGFYWVLGGYDITRDEQMAAFDSIIFAQGRLVWPVPPEWRADARALSLFFMLPVDQPAAWVSAYLPGNAALRALVSQVADPVFTGPLLTAGCLYAAHSCARAIWPRDREIAAVAVLLVLGSGQVLVNGMSSYAMPAHLFFNLIWLRLFLADRRIADLGLLCVGAIATGLHQPVFHPMFAAPFLLMLLLDRRWTRLAVLSLGYLAIGLFWLAWPGMIQQLVIGPGSIVANSGTDPFTRLLEAMAQNTDHVTLFAANLLRFCTWQHMLTVPLAIAGVMAARSNRLVQALALGIVLSAVVVGVILPWQGNGFGYRYLHPVLGNAVLLACFGFVRLRDRFAASRPAFVAATLASLLVLVPMQVWMSYQRYAPFAAANRQIDATNADYLILQAGGGFTYGTMVYNLPDLSNRPIRMYAEYVPDHVRLAQRICKPGTTIAMAGNGFFEEGAAYFNITPLDTTEKLLPALRAPYERAGCKIVVMQ